MAKGRTLAEFRPLSSAEAKLARCSAAGETAQVTPGLPQSVSPSNSIRGSFIRFLALGGDEATPVHEKGIAARGASIMGPLDLQACKITHPISLVECAFDSNVNLQDAHIKQLNLSGSSIVDLTADRVKCDGSLFLRRGFKAHGIRLGGAEIGGDLDCAASTFGGEGAVAITADGLRLGGDFFMNDGFRAKGEVRFLGAEIKGDLTCVESRFYGFPSALFVERTRIGGGVFLNSLVARGTVRISGAHIGGDLELGGTKLLKRDSDALFAEQVVVEGSVIFAAGFGSAGGVNFWGAEIKRNLLVMQSRLKFSKSGFAAYGATVGGSFMWTDVACSSSRLDFREMRISQFLDDPAGYGGVQRVLLDGLRYERIGKRVEARARIPWLMKQTGDGKKEDFSPQPWEQLALVLRNMGHVEDAKLILIEKQKELRRLKLIGTRSPRQNLKPLAAAFEGVAVASINRISRLSHRLYGALAGYGYRPMRTLAWMIAAWALSTAIYAWGDDRGLFAPRAAGLLSSPAYADCAQPPARWTRCPALPSGYNAFDSAMFSLDAILPFVDLKQEADWAPLLRRGPGWKAWDGMLVRATMWVEILFGWITSLLLVSAVGRLMQKD